MLLKDLQSVRASVANIVVKSGLQARFEALFNEGIDQVTINCECVVNDRDTGDMLTVTSDIEVFMPLTVHELKGRIRQQLIDLATHEVDEGLHFQDTRINDPHKPRQALGTVIADDDAEPTRLDTVVMGPIGHRRRTPTEY